jgi:hypothetical protein
VALVAVLEHQLVELVELECSPAVVVLVAVLLAIAGRVAQVVLAVLVL